ncbi:MAG: hypothetical protein D3916_09675 [Candidatus Electrothrix sp. MAN1_4]|nr:hypothetical protein [Candidatus Electrothrix sp. MAN1_4]
MLNYKEKIITLTEKGTFSLLLLLKAVFWCMCFTSVFFVCTGILFLIAGDQDIFFYKRQIHYNQ